MRRERDGNQSAHIMEVSHLENVHADCEKFFLRNRFLTKHFGRQKVLKKKIWRRFASPKFYYSLPISLLLMKLSLAEVQK